MKVTLWGTRGSLAAAGPDTVDYGGDTSAVEVLIDDETALVLDAGSGIRRLSNSLAPFKRIDVLLTHLHMDHIQGLGFFKPLMEAESEVHLWGPAAPRLSLEQRLSRYLSPPLFPVRLRDLANVYVHDLDPGRITIGAATIDADYVCHPGLTFGYRIEAAGRSLAYLPDHEPALGVDEFPSAPEWTSGFDLVAGADLLIHDAQYTVDEFERLRQNGHSTPDYAIGLAEAGGARRVLMFHHDPLRRDAELQELVDAYERDDVVFAREGSTLRL